MKFFKLLKKNFLENAEGFCYAINTMYGKDYYPSF